MELKQNNMTGNYFSERYLINAVSKSTGYRSGSGRVYQEGYFEGIFA